MNEATVWPQNGADRRAVEALRIQSCHLDQKAAGNLRISGFFLCNLHKCVSLVPFPCNYCAIFQNVPKGRKHQYIVDLQFPDTTYCIFSKRPSQFARKRHRLEQPRPAALPSLICRFVWKSPCPPGEPPTPAAHN